MKDLTKRAFVEGKEVDISKDDAQIGRRRNERIDFEVDAV